MRTARITLAAVLFILVSCGFALGAENEVFRPLQTDDYVTGNFDNLIVQWCDFIKNNPDSPETELAIDSCRDFQGAVTNYDLLVSTFEEVLAGGVKNGINEMIMKVHLYNHYKSKGRDKAADDLGIYDGWLNDFIVIGPFGGFSDGETSYDIVYPPEKEIDLTASYPLATDKREKIRWSLFPYEEKQRLMFLQKYFDSSGACSYYLTQFQCDAEKDAVLYLIQSGNYKVWLNGKPVLQVARRNREWVRDTQYTAVRLAEGWNRILIKACSSGTTGVYLADGNFQPLEGITPEKDMILRPLGRTEAGGPSIEAPKDAYSYYRDMSSDNASDAYELIAFAFLAEEEGMEAESMEAMEKAVQLAPEDPVINYFSAYMTEKYGFIPSNIKKNRVRASLKKTLELDNRFVLAYEFMANEYSRDDKIKEAIDELDKALAVNPDYFRAHLAAISILGGENWTPEVIDHWKKVEKIYPSSEGVLRFWYGYYSQYDNYDKIKEYRRKLRALYPGSDSYRIEDANRYLRKGEDEKALAIFRELHEENPDSDWYYSRMRDYYENREMFEKAAEYAMKLAEKYPERESYLETIGDLYKKAGKTEKALEFYQKNLRENPGNLRLRRYVTFLMDEEENFAREYMTPEDEVEKLMKNAPGQEAYPKSSSITVLNETVQKVYADGSSVSYNHVVYKVLDQIGVEQHLHESVGGEVQEVRVINPDGEVMEPLGFQGSSYTLHGLEIGSLIETYARHQQGYGTSFGFNEFCKFYYQDVGTPTLKVRYVLIMDKDLPIVGPVNKHLEGKVEYECKNTPEDEPFEIYVWEAENMPRIEPEPRMLSADEFLPHSYFYWDHEWKEIFPIFKNSYYSYDLRPTELLRETTAKVIEGKEGQEAQFKALYNFIMEEIREPYGSSSAHTTLLSKRGSREGLLLAMLNICGIKWDMAHVTPDLELLPPVNWEMPDPSHFQGTFYRIRPDDGPDVFIEDMSSKRRPIGKLSAPFQRGYAFILAQEGVLFEQIPAEDAKDRADVITDVVMDLDSLTANCSITLPGIQGYMLKERFEETPRRELEKVMAQITNGVFEASVVVPGQFDFPGVKNNKTPFKVEWTCRANRYLVPSAEGFLAKLGPNPLVLQQQFITKSEREHPLAARFYMYMRDSFTIKLGDKYELVKLPESLVLMSEFGKYVLSIEKTDDEIRIKRTFAFSPIVVPTDKYAHFIEFCRTIDNAENVKLVFKNK